MQKLKAWIEAMRPRTLPLSVSGIMVGTGLALREGIFNSTIFVYALLATMGFQILSNFANDYGDSVKGTDNEERLGPKRGLQSGILTHQQMKTAMIVTTLLTLIFVVLLIFSAFKPTEIGYVMLFFALGIAAIIAAIKYTMGKSAYGYYGLGDVFVFLFFGLLSVVGSYFLFGHHLPYVVWILAAIIGLLSAAVINLNNMRDAENDLKSGKHTLAVKLGVKQAKYYHFSLLLVAFILTFIYVLISAQLVNTLLFIPFIPLVFHVKRVYKNKMSQKLDPELKNVALSTFLLALIYLISGLLF